MPESEVPNLKVVRLERRWSQKELADALGIASRTVIRWESGEQSPPIKDLRRAAALFDVSVSFLIGESTERKIVYLPPGWPR